jgi:hypothetical protein
VKVTLDLRKLLHEERITREEYERLLVLGRRQSWRHAWVVLGVMSAIALVLGAIGLLPDEILQRIEDFFVRLYDALGRQAFHAIVFFLVLGGGVLARSGFLTGLSCFLIPSFLRGTAFYTHAAYFVAIEEPAVTVVVFSLLALAGLAVSFRLSADYERLAIIFARTCLILVNMAFWIGSLWGSGSPMGEMPDWVFSLVWAAGLIAILIWGAREGRLFVVNAAISFGSIHFYTQWFEFFGARPMPLFIGGVIGVALAYAVPRYNRYLKAKHAEAPS